MEFFQRNVLYAGQIDQNKVDTVQYLRSAAAKDAPERKRDPVSAVSSGKKCIPDVPLSPT